MNSDSNLAMHLSLSRKMGPPILAIWRCVARYCADFPDILILWRISDTLTLRCSQQMLSRHIQIDQSAGQEQPVGVLVQTAVTDLVEVKYPLEDQERMLDLGPDSRLGAVLRAFRVRQSAVAAALLLDKVSRLRCMLADQLALSGIGRVTPDTGLPTVQQIAQQSGYRAHWLPWRLPNGSAWPRLSTPMWAFMPKYHGLPFFVWCISGSRFRSLFFVELGALMMVASTMVPVLTFRPFS